MKKLVITIISITLIFAIYGEKRSFYCIDETKCVTVWKTYNNVCYIIPGKYYGIVKPDSNYVRTSNISSVDIIWESASRIIINKIAPTEIVKPSSQGIQIIDYSHNKLHYDSLYQSANGRYKQDAPVLMIKIHDNYAYDLRKGKL